MDHAPAPRNLVHDYLEYCPRFTGSREPYRCQRYFLTYGYGSRLVLYYSYLPVGLSHDFGTDSETDLETCSKILIET